jgi:hypothetical protein
LACACFLNVAGTPFVAGTLLVSLLLQISFVKSQILRLISQLQIRKFLSCASRKSQIHKFVMMSLQIANPQISLVSQSANRKFAKKGF